MTDYVARPITIENGDSYDSLDIEDGKLQINFYEVTSRLDQLECTMNRQAIALEQIASMLSEVLKARGVDFEL